MILAYDTGRFVRPRVQVEVDAAFHRGWRRLLVWQRWFFEVTVYPAKGDPTMLWDEWTTWATGWHEWRQDGVGMTLRGTLRRAARVGSTVELACYERTGWQTVDDDPV